MSQPNPPPLQTAPPPLLMHPWRPPHSEFPAILRLREGLDLTPAEGTLGRTRGLGQVSATTHDQLRPVPTTDITEWCTA